MYFDNAEGPVFSSPQPSRQLDSPRHHRLFPQCLHLLQHVRSVSFRMRPQEEIDTGTAKALHTARIAGLLEIIMLWCLPERLLAILAQIHALL